MNHITSLQYFLFALLQTLSATFSYTKTIISMMNTHYKSLSNYLNFLMGYGNFCCYAAFLLSGFTAFYLYHQTHLIHRCLKQ